MTLHRAAAHALVGWSLVAPAQAPTKGTVRAFPSPTIAVWHTYGTKEQCEQDREFLQRDPVIGPQMKSAKPTVNNLLSAGLLGKNPNFVPPDGNPFRLSRAQTAVCDQDH